MESNDELGLPLSGVRILDWTIRQSGPSATQYLADMGAEVVKIETLAGGDPHRRATNQAGSQFMLAHGLRYDFESHNRNKKSMAIDLSKEEGKQIIYSLVAKADVFVQNFRYGVAKKLSMDYKTLQKYNPSLVYANCNGYGRKGKQASQPALDPAIHAASGMMLGIGEANMPPIHLPGGMSDQITGIMLAYAIMLGLFYKERTGKGRELDVSMLGTMISVQTNNILYTIIANKSRERRLRREPANPLVNHYCCKDGRWILLAMFQPDQYWDAFCRALGLGNLIEDPRFCDFKNRGQNSAELVTVLDDVFATKMLSEWLDIFASEELIYSAVKDYLEVVNDPQVLENDFLVEYDHPSLGKLKEIGFPVQLCDTRGTIRNPAPRLGQHTSEILMDILEMSAEEIKKLRDRAVIL
jgi:crotonobetainyl-CoA:carnitine CoA-transferase CaiB-like acyl-CoA transferase